MYNINSGTPYISATFSRNILHILYPTYLPNLYLCVYSEYLIDLVFLLGFLDNVSWKFNIGIFCWAVWIAWAASLYINPMYWLFTYQVLGYYYDKHPQRKPQLYKFNILNFSMITLILKNNVLIFINTCTVLKLKVTSSCLKNFPDKHHVQKPTSYWNVRIGSTDNFFYVS